MATHPASSEGELTAMRASLANRHSLADLGRELKLDQSLRVGTDAAREEIHQSSGALADAWEAVLGAIFLDAGYDSARAWCSFMSVGLGLGLLMRGSIVCKIR